MIVGQSKPPLENVLLHFGVKGMRWGVKNESGDKLDAQGSRKLKRADKAEHKEWKRNAMSTETANKAFQDAVKTYEPVVKKINNDPAFKGKDLTKDRNLAQQYDAVVSTVFNQHLAQASVNLTYNPKTERAVIYEFDRNVGMMRATEVKRVNHADDVLGDYPDFDVELDALGHIVSVKMVETKLQHSDDEVLEQFLLTDDDHEMLMHYGVKGMKWGVRRAASKTASGAKRAYQKTVIGDPDKSGVTRRDVRTATRKARNKADDELEDFNDTARPLKDAQIKAAREGLKQAARDYRTAKETYKTERTTKGRNAAKIALKKAQIENLKINAKAQTETGREERDRQIKEFFEAVFAPRPPRDR